MAWRSGQSHSTDLRSRVLVAVDGGSPAKAVASLFQVSESYIDKSLVRRAATGETEARAQRNHQTLKLEHRHAAIAAEVAARPDVTLEELRAWLFAKLKALLRKAAERTKDGFRNTIGKLLDLFPPAECTNYLANSGYHWSA